jgi:nitrogen regulatory protein PII
MTRVEVLLPPAQLDEIKEALAELGVHDMTLTEVKIVERGSSRRNVYRGSTYVVDFTSKIKVELDVSDRLVTRIVEVLRASLGTAEAEKVKVLLFDVVGLNHTTAGDHTETSPRSAGVESRA